MGGLSFFLSCRTSQITMTDLVPERAPTFKDCRMYEQELPNQDDLVVVRVNKVEDFGAYVTLLEYNNIEGMILSSEVSRKRIRSIHKHLRIGKQDVMQVLRVDKEKGYIDLSKKYVTDEDVESTMERFTKSKTVHSIMKHCAITCGMPVKDLLEQVAWPLYEEYSNEEDEEDGHALDGLNAVLLESTALDKFGLEEEVKDCLIKEITHRLAEQPFKIQAQIDLTCATTEGIRAIKESLLAGKQVADEKNQKLEINLLSTPTYRILTQCTDKQLGMDIVTAAIQAIENAVKERNGKFTVKEAPQEI